MTDEKGEAPTWLRGTSQQWKLSLLIVALLLSGGGCWVSIVASWSLELRLLALGSSVAAAAGSVCLYLMYGASCSMCGARVAMHCLREGGAERGLPLLLSLRVCPRCGRGPEGGPDQRP